MDDITTLEELFDYVFATLVSNFDYDKVGYTLESLDDGREIHLPYDEGEVIVKLSCSENSH